MERFLSETIYNLGELSRREDQAFDSLFRVFPSLELVYVCDKNTLEQISDNIYRDRTSALPKGRDRSYLLKKIKFNVS